MAKKQYRACVYALGDDDGQLPALWFRVIPPSLLDDSVIEQLVLDPDYDRATIFHLYQDIDRIIRNANLERAKVYVEERTISSEIKLYDLGNPYGPDEDEE